MPVGRMPERAHQPLHRGNRPELLDLVHADQMRLDPDGLRRALIVPILVHPITTSREPQITGLVKTDGLTGFFFEFLVKLDRILMQLANAVGHIEERKEAGSVPGRARGEFCALQQHDIRPALLGEMIKHRDAANTAPDYHNTRARLHHLPPGRATTSYRTSAPCLTTASFPCLSNHGSRFSKCCQHCERDYDIDHPDVDISAAGGLTWCRLRGVAVVFSEQLPMLARSPSIIE